MLFISKTVVSNVVQSITLNAQWYKLEYDHVSMLPHTLHE